MPPPVSKVAPPAGPKPCTSCDCLILVSRAPSNWPGMASASCGGACAGNTVYSANPVRYWDGSIYLAETDIATPYGGFLDHRRRYNNQTTSDFNGYNGYNWFFPSMPFLYVSGTAAAVVFDPNNPFWFDKPSSTWNARYGALDVSLTDSGGIYTFVRNSAAGTETTAFDSNGDLKTHTDTAGVVTTATVASGLITELTRIINDGTNNVYESMQYTYYTSGGGNDKIQYALYRRKVGSGGSWTNITRVEYTYHDGSTAFGSAGDLESTSIQEWNGSSWDTESESYYRYYKSGDANGFAHALKYHIGPEGFRRAFQASVNVFTASDGSISGYADHFFKYDGSRRVTEEIAAVCTSCPGGGTTKDTFSYAARSPVPSDGPNIWKTSTTQTLPNSATITVYSNYIGMPIFEKYVDGANEWYKAWKYDADFSVLSEAESSAIDGSKLDFTSDDIVDWSGGTNTALKTTGLIRNTSYYAATTGDDVDGYPDTESVQNGRSGSPVALRKFYYANNTANGQTIYLPKKVRVYPDATTTSTFIDTSWAYTFHSGTNKVATRTTTLPSTSSQNGTASTTVVETFDSYGNMTERTDQLSNVNRFVFDKVLRVMTQSIINYKVSPSGPGESVTTDFTYDNRGRLTESLGPAHTVDVAFSAVSVRTATWHTYIASTKPGTLGNAWALDQHISAMGYRTGSGPYTYTLVDPATILRLDKAGRTVDTITAKRSSGSGALSASDTFSQSDWKAWTHHEFNNIGQLTSSRVYHVIPSSGVGSSPTNYAATTFAYDSLERVIQRTAPGGTITYTVWTAPQRVKEVWVGTTATGATQGNPAGSGGNNLKQITGNQYDGGSAGGDGNLTQVTQYAAASDTRVTTYTYDFRNRRATMDGEIDVYAEFTYDNLDRVTKVDRKNTSSGGALIGRSTTAYDDLGRVYEQRTYAVASGTAGNYLTASTWHDAVGRPYRQVAAGALNMFTHTTYNGAGWVTGVYRGTGTSTSIGSNLVATQTLNEHDEAGNVIRAVSYDRLNTTTYATTGALTSGNARVSYLDIYPDAIGRNRGNANYGVVASFTRSTTIPAGSATVLVDITSYGYDGRVQSVVNPNGAVSNYAYDAAGRRTQVIEDTFGTLPQEVDYTYTLDGQVATQVALNSSTGNQTTTYTYGTTLTDSDVARNDLLVRVAYPDSTGSSDTVYTTYNRLGQKKTVTDQRAVVHSYEYDKLGRQLEDKVTSLGSSGIVDNYVLRIQQQYEVRGMVSKVTSHSATSGGSIRNECEYVYNAFGQMTDEYQEHGGAVNTSTSPSVQYQYETGASGGSQTNNIRQTALVYPDGRFLEYHYGSVQTINGDLSRVDQIFDNTNSVVLAQYTYLGSGLAVRVKYPEPDVWLDLYGGTPGTFAGLDRFNRVTDQKWQNAVSTTPVTIDRYTYTYDASGNRLTRGNPLHTAFDEAYTYDTLNRLTNMDRGASGATRTEAWNLDETGNWLNYDTSTGGTPDLSQTRTANEVNEITDITSTPTWADPGYDAAGSVIAFMKPSSPSSNLTATFDAWDRLVKIVDVSSTVEEYRYDGQRRRAVRLGYTGGALSETRHHFYSSRWQVLEERVGASSTADLQYTWGRAYLDTMIARTDSTPTRLYVTSDAVFNNTAVVSTSGSLVERYRYAVFGERTVMDSSWSSLPTSAVAWDYGYQGLRHDDATGLIHARSRDFLHSVGTWNARDIVPDLNLYLLLAQNPGTYIDPLGLSACSQPVDLTITRPPMPPPPPPPCWDAGSIYECLDCCDGRPLEADCQRNCFTYLVTPDPKNPQPWDYLSCLQMGARPGAGPCAEVHQQPQGQPLDQVILQQCKSCCENKALDVLYCMSSVFQRQKEACKFARSPNDCLVLENYRYSLAIYGLCLESERCLNACGLDGPRCEEPPAPPDPVA